jgi:molybdate transport system substrate-binding protein
MTRALAIVVLASVVGVGCHKSEAPKGPLRVAAASDLSFAFKDVAAAFEKKSGVKVETSFGSTGLLEKQIAEGAPFDVFAAANVSFVDDAIAAKACKADSKRTYAFGHLVMWSPKGKAVATTLADLAKPEIVKVAIANPAHAPYGKAAKQALEKAGVWAAVEPKIVYGENVQQTLQFAQSGNAEVAIVGLALATVTPGESKDIDSSLHDPLEQAMVVCSGAPEAHGAMEPVARDFEAFVASADGRAIMRKYGFLLPGESLTKLDVR